MDPNDPNYHHYSQNQSSSQNFQSFFNTDDSQFTQYYQNSQFSPNLNQVPISEPVQILESLPRDLFGKQKKKVQKTGWSVKEDVTLMSSYYFISGDGAVGTNQKASKLWGRVHALYEQARLENPEELNERNIEMMRSRYKHINKNCSRWLEALNDANTMYRSGMSQSDIEKEAHEIYYCASTNKQKFTEEVVFNEVLSKHPKWQIHRAPTRPRAEDEEETEESGGSSKRSRTSEEGQYFNPTNPETPISSSSTIQRPIGRDKAKKGKGKVVSDAVVEEIRAMRITREKELISVNRRLEMHKEREERKKTEKKMECQLSLLHALMAKTHLTPEDEKRKKYLWGLFQ